MTWTPVVPQGVSNTVKRYHANKSLQALRSVHNAGKLRLGSQIGTASTYGKVRLLGTESRYVLKEMDISRPGLKRIFDNEVRVGSVPGISAVGPRIYAYLISPDGKRGAYIMDNFVRGHEELVPVTLEQYARADWRNACPLPTDPVIRLLKRKLVQFYKVTKGYHGDLHPGNIVLLLHEDTGAVKGLQIFDYGSHKAFKKNITGMCFDKIMDVIASEFKSSYKKKKAINQRYVSAYPNESVPVVSSRGQPYRPNSAMLKRINYRSAANVLPHNAPGLLNAMRSPKKPSLLNRLRNSLKRKRM